MCVALLDHLHPAIIMLQLGPTTQQRPELPARNPATKKSKCTTKTGLPTRPYSKAQELAVRIARIFKNIGKFTAPNTPFHMDG